VRSPRKADNKKQAPQSNTVDCGAKPVTAKKLSAKARLTSTVQASSLAERHFLRKGGTVERVTDFYSIKNRNKRNSFRRGTPDAIRDAPVRSPRKADNKKQASQSNTVDCDAVFWHA